MCVCKMILCVHVRRCVFTFVHVCVIQHVCINIRLCVRNSVVCPNQHAFLPKYQFAIGKHSYAALEVTN